MSRRSPLLSVAAVAAVAVGGLGCTAEPAPEEPDADTVLLGAACPRGPTNVDASRELILTDLSLVESDRATHWSGVRSETAWADGSLHFGRLMADLQGNGVQQNGETYTPFPSTSAFVHRWLDEMERYDETNCDKVPARTAVNTYIRDVWPKVPNETDTYTTRVAQVGTGSVKVTRPRLDMTRPPFRLLAVTFRGDLADLTPPGSPGHANDPERDPPQAGELRLIYGLVDPATGQAKNFTVASTMLQSMAGMAEKPIPMIALLPMIYAMVIISAIVGTHWWMRDKTLEIAVERTPSWLVGGLLAIMAVAVLAEQGKGSAFIYFQF